MLHIIRNARTIRGELDGSEQCSAAGITARGTAPVLQLCRLLVRAGVNPARPLHVTAAASSASPSAVLP